MYTGTVKGLITNAKNYPRFERPGGSWYTFAYRSGKHKLGRVERLDVVGHVHDWRKQETIRLPTSLGHEPHVNQTVPLGVGHVLAPAKSILFEGISSPPSIEMGPYDTVLPADSVEFCPHPAATDIFAVGTYKLDDPQVKDGPLASPDTPGLSTPNAEEPPIPTQAAQTRHGKCLFFRVTEEAGEAL